MIFYFAACAPALLEKLSPDPVGPTDRVLKVGTDNRLLQPFFKALQDTVRENPNLFEEVMKSM